MKNLVTSVFFALTSLVAFGQSYRVSNISQRVLTTDFTGGVGKVNEFLLLNSISVTSQSQSKGELNVEFRMEPNQYAAYSTMVSGLGYFASNNLSSADNASRVEDLQSNIKYYNERIALQKEILAKVSDANSDQYKNMWNEMKGWESSVRSYEKELKSLTISEHYYLVNLELVDETYTPQNSSVTFVNMPGFEYSYLKIEQPNDTLTSPFYQGYFIKYVFTKGKSYATLGAYKSTQTLGSDTLHYSEMFAFGFGQDFYSRHLGRGTKKFLNLYSGYTFGGLLASNDAKKNFMGYFAPAIGVELFKNKYVLIDTKVNYLIPFKDVRYTRGLAFNASFNFVF
ncbi:MAG: hypothetical protein ACKO5Y_00680 [Bacteroidota bacterium]